MNFKKYVILIFILICPFIYGKGRKSPENINQAILQLQDSCNDEFKQTIKKTPCNLLLNLCYPYDGNFKTIYNWTNTGKKKSKIAKYFLKRGIIMDRHIQSIIMIAFQRTLLNDTINENNIIIPYKNKEARWNEQVKNKFKSDSLYGRYIPKDIDDCMRLLDSMFSDSLKVKIKKMTEDEFTSKLHHSLGMRLRNGWYLWSGSRLSSYFNSIGIYHPDNYTSIIFTSYHRHLLGNEIKLDEQVNLYQENYKKAKEDRLKWKKRNNFFHRLKLRYGI
jgi:hypothetical protein